MFDRIIFKVLNRMGYGAVPLRNLPHTVDLPEEFLNSYRICSDYSQTSVDRMYSVFSAIRYVVENKIPGDFVECGVWRGGSAMMAAHALLSVGDK